MTRHQAARPSAVCPRCDRRIQLNANGTFRYHKLVRSAQRRPTGVDWCAGSAYTPAQVRAHLKGDLVGPGQVPGQLPLFKGR